MFGAKSFVVLLMVSLLVGQGCSSPGSIEGVWRPAPGEDSEYIPGPLKNFGPFGSHADALKAACPLILSKPNAIVGHLKDANPQLARRVAVEYCAWLYYTPEHQYEMSMLTDRSGPGDLVTGTRTCFLPTFVSDARYAPGALKYVFALHNHPFGSPLSSTDRLLIEELAGIHDWEIQTRDGEVRLAVIAFFSLS
jgi:hypothetical protein